MTKIIEKIEKTVSINNFIGVYDNYITKEECIKAIKLYEDQNKFNNTVNRIGFEKASVLQKQDQQYFAGSNNLNIWWEELKPMIINFEMAFKHYIENTGANDAYQVPFHFTSLKIQKTLPTEGYHVWHIEHGKGFDNEPRAFVFTIYLNDVEEGGETAFQAHSSEPITLKVQPKQSRMLLFPPLWTHPHMGMKPISGPKYIVGTYLHYV